MQKEKISKEEMTVSQSLTFVNKYVYIFLLLLASVLHVVVILFKKQTRMNILTWIRAVTVVLISISMCSLLYVTPYSNVVAHNFIAATVFLSALICQALTVYQFKNITNKQSKKKLMFMFVCACAVTLVIIATKAYPIATNHPESTNEHFAFGIEENIGMFLIAITPSVLATTKYK